jgi:hypothetical protein
MRGYFAVFAVQKGWICNVRRPLPRRKTSPSRSGAAVSATHVTLQPYIRSVNPALNLEDTCQAAARGRYGRAASGHIIRDGHYKLRPASDAPGREDFAGTRFYLREREMYVADIQFSVWR